ncbi:invasin domain 3-containing protein, partial [Enterobacter roggenkampii]
NGDGTYSATLTGTKPGDVTVMPQVGGKNAVAEGATVTLTAGDVDKAHSSISPKDGSMEVTDDMLLTFTAKDRFGNPIPSLNNISQKISGSSANGSSVGPWKNNNDGTYTATLHGSTKVGDVVVMPVVNGSDAADVAANVELTHGIFNKLYSQVTSSSTNTNVGGHTDLIYEAKDSYGNAVPGITLLGTKIIGNQDSSVSAWEDQGDGSYTATFQAGNKTGSVDVMPTWDGKNAAVSAVTITINN